MLTLAERREAWIADLESGEHSQGSGALHGRTKGDRGDADTDAFCCLGRGCEVAMALDFGIEVTMTGEYGELDYACVVGGEAKYISAQFMPKCVWEALGIDGEQGKRVRGGDMVIDKHGVSHSTTSLDVANDDDLSFKDIAAMLRSGDFWIENMSPHEEDEEL